jgi:acetyl-CoA synthase
MKEQLEKEHVDMGLHSYIIPVGADTTAVIHAANFAIRAALTFGGFKKGQVEEIVGYCRDRVPAFCVALGELDELKVSAGLAAIKLGFPVITDQAVPEIGKIPSTLYEALVSEKDHGKIVAKAISTRGIKIKVNHIPIPVAYSAAFEGERVRRNQMFAQFGGKFSPAFEYVKVSDMDSVEDGKIEVQGPDISDMKEGEAYPLGIYVRVAGRKMQEDYEPIIERQIHTFLNEAQGVFHMGQRNMCWLRLSKEAVQKGFNIRHFGVILHARIHEAFSAIVDKVQITIFTTEDGVNSVLPGAERAYESRISDRGMTDESIDTFIHALCARALRRTMSA